MSQSFPVTRRTLLQGAGASALLALLAACGSDGNATATTAPGGTSGSTGGSTDTTAAASAQEIDTLTVAFPSSISNLYPGQEAGNFNYYIAALIAEALVAPDSTGKLVGALAESWTNPTPTTYVYKLRSGVTFSDGSACTADDVVYSVGLAKDDTLSPNTAYYWANVDKAEKTADDEVTITLASPDMAFEWGPCAANAMWVTAERFVKGGEIGTPAAGLVGTGPYKVVSFEPDKGVELERIDTYWGGKAPVKTVKIEFIPEETTRLLARKSGDIDMAVSISLDQEQQWNDTDATDVLFAPDKSYVGIDFNTAVEPFDDIHVRKAIALACDRATYVEKLLNGHGEVATALTVPQQIESVVGDAAHEKLATVFQMDYDLDAAKAELALSKVPDGFSCKVGVSSSAPQVSQFFQALAATVKDMGITIEVQEMPVEQWYDTIGSADWGLAYMWYFNATGDPAELISWFLADGNPASYSNPKVADLLAQQREEADPAKRVDLIIEAQQVAMADLPYVPLWWGEAATAINDKYTIEDFGPYTLLSPWTSRILTKG